MVGCCFELASDWPVLGALPFLDLTETARDVRQVHPRRSVGLHGFPAALSGSFLARPLTERAAFNEAIAVWQQAVT